MDTLADFTVEKDTENGWEETPLAGSIGSTVKETVKDLTETVRLNAVTWNLNDRRGLGPNKGIRISARMAEALAGCRVRVNLAEQGYDDDVTATIAAEGVKPDRIRVGTFHGSVNGAEGTVAIMPQIKRGKRGFTFHLNVNWSESAAGGGGDVLDVEL